MKIRMSILLPSVLLIDTSDVILRYMLCSVCTAPCRMSCCWVYATYTYAMHQQYYVMSVSAGRRVCVFVYYLFSLPMLIRLQLFCLYKFQFIYLCAKDNENNLRWAQCSFTRCGIWMGGPADSFYRETKWAKKKQNINKCSFSAMRF